MLLSELRRHGVRHQRRRVLLRGLWLGEGEGGLGAAVLDGTLGGDGGGRDELLSLEVVLASEGPGRAAEVGLSVTVEAAAAAEAVAAAAPIASVL